MALNGSCQIAAAAAKMASFSVRDDDDDDETVPLFDVDYYFPHFFKAAAMEFMNIRPSGEFLRARRMSCRSLLPPSSFLVHPKRNSLPDSAQSPMMQLCYTPFALGQI